ncbi:MAG: M15 family metallopeptidase [Microthrixaceae bacterium]|nr:M15 family metallopeptidase [Microthrixaceae bacterium]
MLVDYANPGVDANLQEPFASRLLQLLDFFEHRLIIISGRRSYGEQRVLWERYLAGGNLAARPGTSNHERGLAADLERTDPALSWAEVHAAGNRVGIWFPIIGENWHAEPSPDWTEPLPEEPDMTLDQLAQAFGGALDTEGRIVVPLSDGQLYPLGNVLGFIHGELTRDELLPARIRRVLGS